MQTDEKLNDAPAVFWEARARADVEVVAPCGWRILVRLPEQNARTRSGLYMPDDVAIRELMAGQIGEVIAMGSLCYNDPKRFPDRQAWCKVGDWILMRAHAGTRFPLNGRWYRILTDDSIEAVISSPEEFQP